MDAVNNTEKEIEKVISKFNYVDKHTANSLQELIATLEGVKQRFEEGNQVSQEASDIDMTQCLTKIRDTISRISSEHKELHACVSKVGKSIDKNFVSDFSSVFVEGAFDSQCQKEINRAVSEHLLQHGMLDVADSLLQEAQLDMKDSEREPFLQMHFVLEALKNRNLSPALDWVISNKDKLSSFDSCLEFKLHKLRFIQILEQGPIHQWEAINYSQNFAPFGRPFKEEIQFLMGSLLFVKQGLEKSPYSRLFQASMWDEIVEIFMRESCMVMGLPVESPLSTVIKAGCTAIPPLLTLRQVMQQRQFSGVWSAKDELPVEIDLGAECMFHSVFACPILRQQCTDTNPPVRLICGHVISQDALNRLSSVNKVKCPYCPMEQSSSDARPIFF